MLAKQILALLRESPRQTPSMMAEDMKATASYVRNTLVVLQDLKLVETPARGLYEITPLGEEVLERIS